MRSGDIAQEEQGSHAMPRRRLMTRLRPGREKNAAWPKRREGARLSLASDEVDAADPLLEAAGPAIDDLLVDEI
jgi:hypothetical protein